MAAQPVTGDELGARLAGLDGIGETEHGITRLAWTKEDAATAEWFAAQADALGRRTERDPAGNLWAPPDAPAPWWGIGSHLDSVRGGGRFDGPLGVAAAFGIAARSATPVAVISFADEEGARFNTPTFGSKALTGRLDLPALLDREDDDGISLRDALTAAGLDPDRVAEAQEWLGRLKGFLELHIDQTRDLAEAGSPAGVVEKLAARLRLQVELHGRADHAGTTPPDERRDAMSAAAHLIVAAEDLAAEQDDLRVTAARIHVEPNALTTIPAFVRLWLDARAPDPRAIDAWRTRLASATLGVEAECVTASRSDGVTFDAGVRAALHDAGTAPDLVCFAGHDAGVLAERLPAGMVFVRNPTGVSHSPAEQVDLGDAAEAATFMLTALERL